MNKCVHGVYIGADDGGLKIGDGVSENCEVCKYLFPEQLDRGYNRKRVFIPRSLALSKLFTLWQETQSPEAYARVFRGVRHIVFQNAAHMFRADRTVPSFDDIVLEVTYHILNKDLTSYDPKKMSFYQWAIMKAKGDLINWYHKVRNEKTISLNDPSLANVPDTLHASIEEKLFLKEVKELLSPEELQLFEALAGGKTQSEIGRDLGINQSGISKRLSKLTDRIRELGTANPPRP